MTTTLSTLTELDLPATDIVATTDAEASLLNHVKSYVWLSQGHNVPDGWVYRGPNDLLLKHGEFFDGSAILPDEWAGVIYAVPKHCYDNAYRLAKASKGKLRYVEGTASSIIPVSHAWCVTDDNKVVDPTWAELDHHKGKTDTAYLGVVVPLPVVARVRRSSTGASALWGWHGKWAHLLLTQPYTPDLKLPPLPRKAKKA